MAVKKFLSSRLKGRTRWIFTIFFTGVMEKSQMVNRIAPEMVTWLRFEIRNRVRKMVGVSWRGVILLTPFF